MASELTERQRQVLRVISQLQQEREITPTVREIGEAMGLRSTCTVQRHLDALERKGYIQRDRNANRTLRITKGTEYLPRPTDTVAVPLLGRIAAGVPIDAIQNFEDTYTISSDLVPGDDCFMLEVKGDSMIEAGIFNRDYVVVEPQPTADNGSIVAVMVGDDATVKRLYRESGRIRLQPENATMEPIYVDDNVQILGRVVLVIRRL